MSESSYKVYASEEYVDQRVPPSPDGTHKMLVTDADGNQVWEDRTHWAESNRDVIIDTTTVEILPDNNQNDMYANPCEHEPLVSGESYIVTWDGKEYEATAEYYPPVATPVGNPYPWGGEDNGFPFAIAIMPFGDSETYLAVWAKEVGTHTVKIEQNIGDTIHPLDPKYLPEDIVKAVDGFKPATNGNVVTATNWMQNDPYSPGYVLNRTHYVEPLRMTELGYADLVFTYDDESGLYYCAAGDLPIEGNEEPLTPSNCNDYIIWTWNGKHSTAPKTVLGSVGPGMKVGYIGNGYIVDSTAINTGDYYVATMLGALDSSGLLPPTLSRLVQLVQGDVIITASPDAVSLSIGQLYSAAIKQLDEQYIPDTIARTSDIPAAVTDDHINELIDAKAIQLDTTLTVEGAAADAKSTGDMIIKATQIITNERIDAICGGTIYSGDEVAY